VSLVLISLIIPLVLIRPKTLYDASFKNWEEYNFNYYVGWGKYNYDKEEYEEGYYYREDIIVDLKQEEAREFFEDVNRIRVVRYYGRRKKLTKKEDIVYCLLINRYNESIKAGGMLWSIDFYKNGKTLASAFYDIHKKRSIMDSGIYFSDLTVNNNDYNAFAEKYFKTNDIGGQADE
jgi:hypothetical protein